MVGKHFVAAGYHEPFCAKRNLFLNKPNDILEKYASAFRDLVNARVWAGEDSPQKLLRLNDESDWGFICAAMDIVGDASLAIENFLQFALEGPTRYENIGEKYLRLYGVLSATYVQQEAVSKLYALMNCQNPKEIKAEFKNLEIRLLRHQLASHSLDFLENGRASKSYVPVRIGLSGHSCTITENRGDQSRTFKLDEAINIHCEAMISVLDLIYEKSIKTFFKGQDNKVKEFNERLKDLRFERDGNLIVKSSFDSGQPEFRITFVKST